MHSTSLRCAEALSLVGGGERGSGEGVGRAVVLRPRGMGGGGLCDGGGVGWALVIC